MDIIIYRHIGIYSIFTNYSIRYFYNNAIFILVTGAVY